MTGAGVDSDAGLSAAKATFENLEVLRHEDPASRRLNPRHMITSGPAAPLHEGARRYDRERGWL